MKTTVVIAAAATTLAVVPLTAGAASAPAKTTHGTLAFTDYTPDPAVLGASEMLHVVTGRVVTNYCQGGRVPALPQDVNSHALTVSSKHAILKLVTTATGAWGVDVSDTHGRPIAATSTAATDAGQGRLTLRLPSGHYLIASCNLGGATTAQVSYTLTPSR